MMNTIPLGEVAHVNMGSAPPGQSYNSIGEGLPMIAGAGDYGEKYPEPKKWTTEPTRVSEIGDLIVCVRATIGDLNWADKEYCLGRGVAGIRPKKGMLDINFAAHYINTKKNDLARLGTGSTFLAIRRADLEDFPIPLLPLAEQKRIASILDKADAIRRTRRQAIQLADEFLRSVFLDMFGDPVINPNGWETKRLNEICKKITDGTHDTPKRLESGAPFITGKHIKPFFIDFDGCDYVSLKDHKEIIKRCDPQYGDILYTNIGVNVGTAAFNHWDKEFSMKNVALLKPDNEKIFSRYLEFLLNHNGMKNKILGGSSVGGAQKFLSLSQINRIKIPLPSTSLQERFEKIVSTTSNFVILQKSAEQLSGDFFISLSQRAFRGEL